MTNEEFKVSTPRPLIYPKMRNESEEQHWIKNYSEIVKIMYWILCEHLQGERVEKV